MTTSSRMPDLLRQAEAGPSTLPSSAAAAAAASSSSLSRGSRILVLSPDGVPLPSLAHLVGSITGQSSSEYIGQSSLIPAEEEGEDDGAEAFVATRPAKEESEAESSYAAVIPWTIDNRYYTASVHFRIVSLELPSKSIRSKGDEGSDSAKARSRLKEELKDVSAVVLVQQGGKTLETHQSLLDQLSRMATSAPEVDQTNAEEESDELDEAMPFGFGLSVSTVISLPTILAVSHANGHGGSGKGAPALPSKSQLVEFYAENGWEYIDLGLGLNLSRGLGAIDDEESDEEDDNVADVDSAGSDEDDGEYKGLPRVKEALEANMWPNLERKTSHRDAVPVSSGSVQGDLEDLDPPDQDEDDFEAMFRNLDLNLPSLANGATSLHPPYTDDADDERDLHAEPSLSDAALAERFLSSITAFEKANLDFSDPSAFSKAGGQEKSTVPETEEERNRNQQEALRRLEAFLKSEDENWPGDAPSVSTRLTNRSSFGASGEGQQKRPDEEEEEDGFDDDFTSFISGAPLPSGSPSGTAGPSLASFASPDHANGPGRGPGPWPELEKEALESMKALQAIMVAERNSSSKGVNGDDGEEKEEDAGGQQETRSHLDLDRDFSSTWFPSLSSASASSSSLGPADHSVGNLQETLDYLDGLEEAKNVDLDFEVDRREE